DRKPELRLQVIDDVGQLVKVRFNFVQKKVLVAVAQLDLELMLGMYVLCHRRVVIIGAHKFYDQRFREIGELVGDAYTAHQELMVRISQTYVHDAAPKQEEGQGFHLILLPDVGTAHFNDLPEERMCL